MCGFFGVFSRKSDLPDVERLNVCRDSLYHRGPDMAGNYLDRNLYLGFRRLSILDLSAEGNQPMMSADKRYVIVFNGEIYNFLELRKELEGQGEQFKGHSDTEILLSLYVKYGVKCLKKINGMFSIVIYDKVERTLLLVRDRLGVKPLFFWKNDHYFAFASEMRAFHGLPGFPSNINDEALGLYFRLGIVPEWSSIYPEVHKLLPGCWIKYQMDTGNLMAPVQYWDLPSVGEVVDKSEDEWLDEIEFLLWDSTRIRLRSDVPLGIFLSGGIDSGLVAAAASKQLAGLTALTMGFAGEVEDETSLALATAQHLEIKSITRNIDLTEGLETLPKVMAHFDEPFSDTSALPTSLVSAEARKQYTVVLSGDAGDEVFGGYPNHVRAWQWRKMDLIPLSIRQTASAFLSSLSPNDCLQKRFSRRVGQPVGRFGLGGSIYPFQDWLNTCIKPEFNLAPLQIVKAYNNALPQWDGASSIDLAQRTDLRTYMLEDILIKVDRMSMLHSLEVRSPFLDYRMVELGLRIPSHLRTKNGQNKYLLRRLADRHLPKCVCNAAKRGFSIPLSSWLYDNSSEQGLKAALMTNSHNHVDPFIRGGAERLWQLGKTNKALTSAVIKVLCYRWWCNKGLAIK